MHSGQAKTEHLLHPPISPQTWGGHAPVAVDVLFVHGLQVTQPAEVVALLNCQRWN